MEGTEVGLPVIAGAVVTLTLSLLVHVTVTTPTFLTAFLPFFLTASFTVIFAFPSLFAFTTPFFVTEATFFAEEVNEYTAFLFLFLITIFFFSPSFKVILLDESFAFFAPDAVM